MTVAARLSRALAMLLLAWQAVVTQAHVHPEVAARAPVASVAAAASTAPHRPDSPVDCPVCREVAHAGPYLTPAAVDLAPPATIAPWSAPLALGAFDGVQRSHSWRSRAPPVLHA